MNAMSRRGFCIYVNTLFQGPVPIERDENGYPVVYASEEAAQKNIAEDMIERLEQFLHGERDFEDAVTVEEYVVEVDVTSEGAIVDADGNHFAQH